MIPLIIYNYPRVLLNSNIPKYFKIKISITIITPQSLKNIKKITKIANNNNNKQMTMK